MEGKDIPDYEKENLQENSFKNDSLKKEFSVVNDNKEFALFSIVNNTEYTKKKGVTNLS